MVEAVAKKEGLTNEVLAIYDMGQTVVAELMACLEEGRLSSKIRYAVVFNGSTIVDEIEFDPYPGSQTLHFSSLRRDSLAIARIGS